MEEQTNPSPNMLEIPIPESIIDYFEQLDFEINGLKILHTHALQCNVAEEKCEKIKAEFLEKYNELQILKAEIEKEYLKGINFKSWNIIYNRGMMYVYTN